MWNNISRKLERAVHIAFSGIFMICAFFTLFHFERYSLKFEHSTIKTLLFAVIAFGVIKGYCACLEKYKVKANLIRAIIAVILIIVQWFFFLKVMTTVGWDVQEVVGSAEFGMYNGYYFARLPQNLLLHFLLRGWYLFFDFIPFSAIRIMEVLNLLCVDVAILMLYFVSKKMYGQKTADKVFISAAMLIAFHPTLSTIYSDTMAMPYPIGILFFAVYGMDSKKIWMKILCGLGVGFLGIFGYNIKPTVFIVYIAIVIFLVLRYRKNIDIKGTSLVIGSALMAAVITFGSIYIIEKPIKVQLAEEWPEDIPHSILHYIGLGLSNPKDGTSGYGTFSEKEVEWTHAHRKNENYKKEAMEHIVERIKEYGIIGYPAHLMNKVIWSGSDGTFFYGREGDFHLEEQDPQNTVRGYLQNAIYRESSFYQKWFSSWMQGVWFSVCILCSMSILSVDDRNVYVGIAKLSVCGLFLFLMFFENRARYLFLFLPVILLAAMSGDSIKIKKSKLCG